MTTLYMKLLTETDCSLLFARLASLQECEGTVQRKARLWDEEGRDYHLTGGDFVTAVYEGNLRKAYIHADKTNLSVLELVTGIEKDAYLGWE